MFQAHVWLTMLQEYVSHATGACFRVKHALAAFLNNSAPGGSMFGQYAPGARF